MAGYQLFSIGRHGKGQKRTFTTFQEFSVAWGWIFSVEFLQPLWVIHNFQVRKTHIIWKIKNIGKLTKRFASTAIDWLGGPSHMVESGANSDLR